MFDFGRFQGIKIGLKVSLNFRANRACGIFGFIRYDLDGHDHIAFYLHNAAIDFLRYLLTPGPLVS